jgi:hypothetical protein
LLDDSSDNMRPAGHDAEESTAARAGRMYALGFTRVESGMSSAVASLAKSVQ